MSTVADKLREARALVERGWTQEAFARRRNGATVLHDSRDACSFCIAGALMRVIPDYYGYGIASGLFSKAVGLHRLDKWNDAPGRTQAEVLAAFDKAIALAEQEAVSL